MSYEEITEYMVECDLCNTRFDEFFEDQYDADIAAEESGWLVGVEVKSDDNGFFHEHICDSCSGEIHTCEVCDDLVFCEYARHCDDVTCSTECWGAAHEYWGQENPGEIECGECEWPNPHHGAEAPAEGEWSLV